MCCKHGKIKILYVINRLEVGGASVVAADIAEHIDYRRFDFTIVAGSAKFPDNELISHIQDAGVEIIHNSLTPPSTRGLRYGFLRVSLAATFGAWRMFWIIRKKKPDIVHTNTTLVGWVAPLVAWLARTKIVVHTQHVPLYMYQTDGLKGLIFKTLDSLSKRFIHKIVVLTAYEKEIRRDLGFTGIYGTTVIPNGVDHNLFRRSDIKELTALKQELDVPEGMKIVTTVGRLEEEKDPWTIIEAARMIIQKMDMSSVIFLIVGDGSLKSELEAHVRKSECLKNKVRFLGVRSQKEVAKILSISNAFALASLHEGFGIVVLEAMMSGLPVVVTDAVPNLVQDGATGFVVRKHDTNAMAKKLFTILNHPDMAFRMGQQGCLYAQQFSISAQVKEYERLYSTLIKRLQIVK